MLAKLLTPAAAATVAILTPAAPIDPHDPKPISLGTHSLKLPDTGLVAARVSVDPDGRIIGCETVGSSGFPTLDDAACETARRSGQMRPARDRSNRPQYGVMSHWWRWEHGRAPIYPHFAIDLSLEVNRLPDVKMTFVVIETAIAVNDSGQITDCSAAPIRIVTLGVDQHAYDSLAAIACSNVRKNWHARAPVDASGASVSSIQSVRVAFERTAATAS